jgi:hypothetical protein
MPQHNSSSRSGGSQSPYGDRERYDVLQEVMEQHVDAVESSRRPPQQPATRRRGRVVLLAVLVVVFVVIWWKGNDWLGPPQPPPQTTSQLQTDLRVAMYLQVQRIKAFQLRTGHLPDQLNDAGPPVPGIRYQKLDDRTYELSGENGRVTLTYRSDQPIGALLGDAASRLGL